MAMDEVLDWATWPWNRCRAVREPRPDLPNSQFFGKCELRRGHANDHALDRGFYIMRWSTDWTGYG